MDETALMSPQASDTLVHLLAGVPQSWQQISALHNAATGTPEYLTEVCVRHLITWLLCMLYSGCAVSAWTAVRSDSQLYMPCCDSVTTVTVRDCHHKVCVCRAAWLSLAEVLKQPCNKVSFNDDLCFCLSRQGQRPSCSSCGSALSVPLGQLGTGTGSV
jgi:hypothetical protein